MKRAIVVLLLSVGMLLVGCGDASEENIDLYMSRDYYNTLMNGLETDCSGTVNVRINVQDYGSIDLELYGDKAPITVRNFVYLAEHDFYDGLTFHRVIPGFMIQGGSTDGLGYEGSENTIKGEFSANDVDNDISHERGVISMARTGQSKDSASSQFFICQADSTYLDGSYAAFGRVTDGMDVVDAISEAECQYFCSACGNIFFSDDGICTNTSCIVHTAWTESGTDYSDTYCEKSSPVDKIVISSVEVLG